MKIDHADTSLDTVHRWLSLHSTEEHDHVAFDASTDENFSTEGHYVAIEELPVNPAMFFSKGYLARDDCLTTAEWGHRLFGGWPDYARMTEHFGDEDASDQIEMLPSSEEVLAVVSELETDDLRDLAASVMNAAVASARRGHCDLDTVRFLNGWFASMEETVAAGDDLEEILSRRRALREPANR